MTAGWRTHAACRRVPPSTMFPPPGDVPAFRAALAVCSGCPVRRDCLLHALEAEEAFGVWGGTSGKQRWRIAYHRRRGLSLEELVAAVLG